MTVHCVICNNGLDDNTASICIDCANALGVEQSSPEVDTGVCG